MTGRRRITGAALLLGLLTAPPAMAQTTSTQSTVQDVIAFLVTNRGVLTNDFDRDRAAADATAATMTRALLAAITTLPVGSAPSGFVYRLNPTLGTTERASETFGPFFVERARTAGAGQASVGFTLQHAAFSSLDGMSLRDGSFVTTANQFTDETKPFDTETLTLNIHTTTATIFGNVGLTDRVDVGAVLPIVRLDVSGWRLNSYRGRDTEQARASAHTVGIGDIGLRTKVRLTPEGPAALAAGAEVRLPTGREQDLLGAANPSMRLLAIGSAEAGPANVYGNFSVAFGGLGRELNYSGAVAMAATPRVTLVGELAVRHMFGMPRIAEVVAPHPRIKGVQTTRLMPAGADETIVYAVAGAKWNVADAWLLHAHVLVPVNSGGLTARITPAIALDYSFTR